MSRFFLGLLTIACVAPAGVADTVTVRGEIVTSADLNPNYRGDPSPVNLVVFQLRTPDAFQNADFFSLYDPEASVLGDDLIQRTQRLLRPGETIPQEWQFDEEARFIGVIAAFRDIENAQWRAFVELPDRGLLGRFFRRNRMFINVDSLTVTVVTNSSEDD